MYEMYASLEGQWQFHRTIPQQGHAEGIVQFKPMVNESHRLYYQEQGRFYPKNVQKSFNIQRDYIYEFSKATILIYHARSGIQGELFLELKFNQTSSQAQATHLCKQDLYCASFDWLSKKAFTIAYQVKGPKKNYQIQTEYLKIEYK